jgi:hypothetical protein
LANSKQPRALGRLIALDGPSGYLSAAAARALFNRLGAGRSPRGVSLWDASSVFSELRYIDPGVRSLSPRSLILLYASDLLFRLRWEIRPAIEQGAWVIAAPYVESAVAFGLAAGLDESWLRTLFDFAPAAGKRFRCEWEGVVPRSAGRFFEYLSGTLASGSAAWSQWELHARFDAHFEKLEREARCKTIEIKPVGGGRKGRQC